MAKRENKGEISKQPDVLTYYCAYFDEDGVQSGVLYFRTKEALFAAASMWLDQGRSFTAYEEGMEFSDRQPLCGA